jgi:hypothetical protein
MNTTFFSAFSVPIFLNDSCNFGLVLVAIAILYWTGHMEEVDFTLRETWTRYRIVAAY